MKWQKIPQILEDENINGVHIPPKTVFSFIAS